jgi:Ran GTPase-activating protein (RanGAP) involved in mRNA processing and transport
MADILVLALDERREKLKCQLKVLDLSKNNLDKEGIKVLAGVLSYNNVLEVLDISKNRIGVSGAD